MQEPTSALILFISFCVIAGLVWLADKIGWINLGRWNNIITIALGGLAVTSLLLPLLIKSDCGIKINDIVTDKAFIQPDQSMVVTAVVENPDNHPLLYSWQSTNGQMNPGLRTTSVQSTYTAPPNLVNDIISVVVTAPGCASVSLAKQIQVIK